VISPEGADRASPDAAREFTACLVACVSIERSADTIVVVAFTEYLHVPALGPRQIDGIDDPSPHKAPHVRRLIDATTDARGFCRHSGYDR
jgi:hypothetical protein